MLSPIAAQDTEGFGAPSRAMGGAGVMNHDVWSALNNPAGLAAFEGLRAGVSYRNRFMLSEMADKSAAFGTQLGDNHFGLGLSSFGYSLFSRTRVGLGYARPLGKDLTAGVRANYHHVRLGENYGSTGTVTAELGAIYSFNEQLSLGAHVFNPGNARVNDYDDERLESLVRVGMRYDFSEKLFAVAEVTKPMSQSIFAAAGITYRPGEHVVLRAGANNRAFSFGMGAVFSGFLFDISAGYHQLLGFTPEVSLVFHAPR
jgi:long-subunit fatty acid transport protein